MFRPTVVMSGKLFREIGRSKAKVLDVYLVVIKKMVVCLIKITVY